MLQEHYYLYVGSSKHHDAYLMDSKLLHRLPGCWGLTLDLAAAAGHKTWGICYLCTNVLRVSITYPSFSLSAPTFSARLTQKISPWETTAIDTSRVVRPGPSSQLKRFWVWQKTSMSHPLGNLNTLPKAFYSHWLTGVMISYSIQSYILVTRPHT